MTLLAVEAIGVRIELDLAPLLPEEQESVSTAWSRARTERHDLDTVRLGVDSLRLGGGFARTKDNVSSQVTFAAIRANAGRLVMLHAAGLAEPSTGRTVAFVGRSGMGKTTLTQTLGRQWGYVTDETVALDPQSLKVVPYPKPLSVKVAPTGPKDQISPDELGLLPAPTDCRLARIVLLDRDPGHHGAPQVRAHSIVRMVSALTRELSSLGHWPHPLAEVASVMARTGGPLILRYREAAEVVQALDQLDSPGTIDWQHLRPESRVEPGPAPTGTWRRGPYRDAIGDDTAVAVLHRLSREEVTLLDGIGPTLWRAADHPRTLSEMVAIVEARHGQPPGGDLAALVRETLTQLVSRGLLVSA